MGVGNIIINNILFIFDKRFNIVGLNCYLLLFLFIFLEMNILIINVGG